MADEPLNARTVSLLGKWITNRLQRRNGRGCWPNIACKFEHRGLATVKITAFSTGRSTRPREDDDISELGWVFLSLPERQQSILFNYFLMTRDEWSAYRKSLGLSRKRLRIIFLDLQARARKRGIDV
jgi:hypothetical protein